MFANLICMKTLLTTVLTCVYLIIYGFKYLSMYYWVSLLVFSVCKPSTVITSVRKMYQITDKVNDRNEQGTFHNPLH